MMKDYRDQLSRLSPRQREALAAQLSRSSNGKSRLVAYISGTEDSQELEKHLSDCLPEHALPSAIISLAELPKTPNGKVDRRALADQRSAITPSLPQDSRPLSDLERELCRLWKEVLQVPHVGLEDDFYRLGGDSILSIQVVSKASQAGLSLTMKQFVANRTVSALAAAMASAPARDQEALGQAAAHGAVPLTPIQHWFFSNHFAAPAQWNQEVLLEMPHGVSEMDISQALTRLCERHDSLRASFHQREGRWTSSILEEIPANLLVDASDLKEAAQLHSQFDLERGELFKAAWLADEHQLFIVAHHLAVDHVTWGLLREELASLLKGESLPPANTSFYAWSHALVESTSLWQREVPFWNRMLLGRGHLPAAIDAAPTEAESQQHLQTLPTELIGNSSRVMDLLLTSLVQSLDDWAGEAAAWRIGLENHGRQPHQDLPDVSQTAGWFTAYHQVTFDRATLDHVSERLREIPNHGLGFGVLRYLTEPSALERTEDAEILFNYLGKSTSMESIAVDTGQARSPGNRRSHRLEINAQLTSDGLQMHWHFSPRQDNPESIARLAETFADKLGGLAKASLTRDFPLTHNQEALLWHHLQQPERDAGLLPVTFDIEGALDLGRLEDVWNSLVQRHEALRTSVHWLGMETPVQRVHETATLRLAMEHTPIAPLPLDQVPNIRVSVEKVSDQRHRVHWLCHHLFLDGWSAAQLCQELVETYTAPQRRSAAPITFESYAQLQQASCGDDAKAYWIEHLRDAPVIDSFLAPDEDVQVSQTTLTTEQTRRLTETAEGFGVTSATLIQVGWAVVLARLRDSSDRAVFGSTVSGRALPLRDIQKLIGLCANTCPRQIHWDAETSLKDLVLESHRASLEGLPYEHVAPAQIQEWIGLPQAKALFESLLMIANYPQSNVDGAPIRITDFKGPITSVYPITLAVEPGSTFILKWFCQSHWSKRLPWLQASFTSVIDQLTQEPDQLASGIVAALSEPPAVDRPELTVSSPIEERINDRVEDFVASLWQDLFQQDEIHRDATFRSLGGTSLMAAQLTTKLGLAFNTRLPLDFVFKTPSIAAMAELVRRGEKALDWPIIVPIRPEGSLPPLFIVHGLGGGVYDFFDWPKLMDKERPIYALQAPMDPLDRMEAIASRYIEEIQKVQPHGSYHFSSFCFGAAVAFEMACQLEAMGEQVGYLGMIDGMIPALKPKRLAYISAMLWNSSARDFAEKARNACLRMKRLVTKGKASAPDAAEREGYPEAYREIAKTHTKALHDYHPAVHLAAEIHLIRSLSHFANADSSLGWDQVCQKVIVDEVPCQHHEIFYSHHVAEVTAYVNRGLLARAT